MSIYESHRHGCRRILSRLFHDTGDEQRGPARFAVVLLNAENGMTSDARDVDEYLNEVPEDRLEAMRRIRDLIRETHPGYEESMQYGMPAYSRNGLVEVAFNSQKQNIALYLTKADVANKYRNRFPRSATGKGCFRYRNPSTIDFDLMHEMLVDHRESDEAAC